MTDDKNSKYQNLAKQQDEDDECNYIKKDDKNEIENKNRNEAEEILTEDLKKTQERHLGKEVGGLEKNYEKIKEDINESMDAWDDLLGVISDENAPSSTYQSFIHKKKKGQDKGGMNKMILTQKDEMRESLSYVERLRTLRKDRSHENDGGIQR